MSILSLVHGIFGSPAATAVRRVFRFEAPLPAAAERAFPLLCPIREQVWIQGWRASVVHSESGVAEDNAVFRTRLFSGETWITSRHEPDAYRVEYSIVGGSQATLRLDLALLPEPGDRCRLRITRTYTGIGFHGRARVRGLTEAGIEKENALLALQLSHYLRTAEMLRR
jgi:hypothetical protein